MKQLNGFRGRRPAMASALVVVTAAMLVWSCAGRRPWPLVADSELAPADVIVVLGYGPPVDESGAPVAELVRRVEKGVELRRAGLAPALIMTGGNTYRDYYESAVMKEAAVSLGVPAEAVIEEREAMDTIGNARGAARLMAERGWTSCIVVSSPYHLRRARKLFEAAGVSVQTAGSEVPAGPGYGIAFTLYEMSVRVNYWFINEEKLARGDQGEGRNDQIRGPVRLRTETAP